MDNFFRIKYFFLIAVSLTRTMSFSQTEIHGNISTEIIQKKQLGYALRIPQKTTEKKPLLIFLHGDGEKGSDIEKVKIHGPFKYLKNHELDMFVLAPQCPENELWDAEILYRLILKIQKANNVDPDRIYLTGLSSGGWATWNLAFLHPEMFAAIVPISGFADIILVEEVCKLKTIPIKIFHGLLDNVVSVNDDIAIYKELKACNAEVSLTIFDDSGHDSWSRVYDNPEIYEWLLKQNKT